MILKTMGYLDRFRLVNGNDMLKAGFRELCEGQGEVAVGLINDKRLLFASLFTLLPEIEELDLCKHLNSRNTIAIKICKKILKVDTLLTESSEEIISALKWILTTGAYDDGLNNEYDRILDGTAALLIITYNDKTILPIIADMIFKRNRKGVFTHDLVWAFFKANNKDALKIIAGFLRSANKDDIDLVCKLLNIEPIKYNAYLSWLNENYPYIVFTGESFNLTSNPQPVTLDLEVKI